MPPTLGPGALLALDCAWAIWLRNEAASACSDWTSKLFAVANRSCAESCAWTASSLAWSCVTKDTAAPSCTSGAASRFTARNRSSAACVWARSTEEALRRLIATARFWPVCSSVIAATRARIASTKATTTALANIGSRSVKVIRRMLPRTASMSTLWRRRARAASRSPESSLSWCSRRTTSASTTWLRAIVRSDSIEGWLPSRLPNDSRTPAPELNAEAKVLPASSGSSSARAT